MKKRIFIMIISSFFITSCQAYYMPSGSMENTLQVGDRLFALKVNYTPERGDVIVFKAPHDLKKDYIKRCVAVAGDKLEIKEGGVFINGKRQDEPFAKGKTMADENNSIQGIVPEGHIAVLGDNRENSLDSRYFGYVDIEEHVTGKAMFIYLNLDDMGRFGWIE